MSRAVVRLFFLWYSHYPDILSYTHLTLNIRKITEIKRKIKRAEPIAALYEQGRVHHVGSFDKLEEQMTSYVPSMVTTSPDRMDALVWGLSELSSRSSTLILA